MLKKPDLKQKDIEFVLVEKEAKPINKNTKFRSDKDSQAGGKHDPKRKVSEPKPPAPKAEVKKPTPKPVAPPKPQVQQKPQVKPQVKPQPQVQKAVSQPVVKPQTPAPKAPAPKPMPAPVAPKIPTKPLSEFNIPIPKSSIPQVAQPTAPLTPAPKIGGGSSGGATGGSSSPAPSFSASSGGGSPNGRFSNSSGYSNGNLGNPGPGNPNGAPGIDTLKEPDFGPYMRDLQRRIKMNWDPPKGNESKRVVLLFKISKDGRLLSVSVHKSSGLATADNAAINAVKLTAPFRPLPPEFRGSSVDIQFTFDYNVLGASMY
jgi:TonB family protein